MERETPNETRAAVDDHRKVGSHHLDRAAYVYVRQSSLYQVEHHLESRRRQYDRVEWAVAAGWPRERVVVVDDDQGETATLPNARSGFARMVSAVARGEVGIVLSLEGARLARNGPDWAHLLFLCRWTDTLIGDEHGIFDMKVQSDRMVLGLRGQMSELEIDHSIQRMQDARWSKVRRGELLMMPPPGYDIDDLGHLIITRDEAVAQAIRTVFDKFDELGSARQVWVWWRDQGMLFPVRRRKVKSHPVKWRPPVYRLFLATLHNPIYAGAYAYGRSKTVRELDPEKPDRLSVHTRRVARDDWPVLIRDHHDAYISWERFERIQEQLRNNSMTHPPDHDDHQGPVREGKALLQGLVRCGHCGRRMVVNFGGGRRGRGAKRRTPQYRCRGDVNSTAKRGDCHTVGSQRIDAVVVEAFLAATGPASLDVALQAEEQARLQQQDVHRYWQLQVEKAEYEAQRAERQYREVEPEYRLVARTLEREWNDRLVDLQAVRDRAAEAHEDRASLCEEELERIHALSGDLEAIWHAPTTTDRDRKRLLRCIVEEVQLRTEEKHYHVRIVWKGGARTDREVVRHGRGGLTPRTSEDTVELVCKLATEFEDAQIARVLNKQGRRTGRGNTFTKVRVTSLRGKYGIPACPKKPPRDPREGPFTADEAADELGVHTSTIRRWLDEGILPGKQVTPGAPWQIILTEDLRHRLLGGDAPVGWVGITEAARRLGLSTSHVSYLVKKGKLPAMRTTVGKRKVWRIDVRKANLGPQSDLFEPMQGEDTQEA